MNAVDRSDPLLPPHGLSGLEEGMMAVGFGERWDNRM